MKNTIIGYTPNGFLYIVGRDNKVMSIQVNMSPSQLANDFCHLPKFDTINDARASYTSKNTWRFNHEYKQSFGIV